jgi:hypothetical protein
VLGRSIDLRTPGAVERAIGPDVLSFELVGLAGFALILLRTSRGHCSSTELHVLDALITWLPPWAAGTTVFRIAPELRPELLLEIMTAHVLMVRAVIVPSTPRRTFRIGSAVAAPLLATTYAYYAEHVPELGERCATLGVQAWSRDQIAAWWSDVLRRRQAHMQPRQGSGTPRTSETMAVDFRDRVPR